jgi:hypothetical protein
MPEPVRLRGKSARAALDTERYLHQARAFELRALLSRSGIRVSAAIRGAASPAAPPALLADLASREAEGQRRLVPLANAQAFCRRVVAAAAPIAGLRPRAR